MASYLFKGFENTGKVIEIKTVPEEDFEVIKTAVELAKMTNEGKERPEHATVSWLDQHTGYHISRKPINECSV